jgi:hypothetical protein
MNNLAEMDRPVSPAANGHRYVERNEERWIMLRTLELLAKQIAGDSWEQVAAEVFARAQIEYSEASPGSRALMVLGA